MQVYKRSSKLYIVIFSILVFAILFQDLALQEYFGTIARCPVVFLAPIFFVIIFFLQGSIYVNKLVTYCWRYVLVTNITGVIMMFITVVFFTSFSFSVYDETIPIKFVKASAYNITYLFTALCLYNLILKISLTSLNHIFLFLTLFLIGVGFCQYFFDIHIPFINFTELEEIGRITLTTSEPSVAAPTLITISAIAIALRIYLKKKLFFTIFIGILSLATLVLIGSKTALLIMPFSIFWAMRKNFTWKALLYALLLLIPFLIIILQIVIPQISVDIESFTSFSTRVTCFLASFQSLIMFPLGEGYGTYLVHYPSLLLPLNQYLTNVTNLPFIDTELVEMVSSGKNLPGKSGIPNEIIYNGFSAVLFFFYFFKTYTQNIAKLSHGFFKLIFAFLGAFLFIEFFVGVVLETSYYYFLPFIIIEKILSLNKENNSFKIA